MYLAALDATILANRGANPSLRTFGRLTAILRPHSPRDLSQIICSQRSPSFGDMTKLAKYWTSKLHTFSLARDEQRGRWTPFEIVAAVVWLLG